MPIRDELKTQTIQAMKDKNEARVSALRMISAAIKQKDIDSRTSDNREGISDEAILSLMQGMIKQRQESIKMYEQGGRSELVAKEQAEIEVIQSFLPKQLNPAEMDAALKKVITETGAQGMKDMGKVMAELKARFPGQMDMNQASAKVKEMLLHS